MDCVHSHTSGQWSNPGRDQGPDFFPVQVRRLGSSFLWSEPPCPSLVVSWQTPAGDGCHVKGKTLESRKWALGNPCLDFCSASGAQRPSGACSDTADYPGSRGCADGSVFLRILWWCLCGLLQRHSTGGSAWGTAGRLGSWVWLSMWLSSCMSGLALAAGAQPEGCGASL